MKHKIINEILKEARIKKLATIAVYDTWSASDREKMQKFLNENNIENSNIGSKVTVTFKDDLQRAIEQSHMKNKLNIHFEIVDMKEARIAAENLVDIAGLNKTTEDFLKEVQAIMRSRGYKYSSGKASASIEWRWTKADGKTIALSGWHGTGKWGTGKMVLALYKNHELVPMFTMPGRTEKEYGAGLPTSENIPFDKILKKEHDTYLENLKKTLVWIKENA